MGPPCSNAVAAITEVREIRNSLTRALPPFSFPQPNQLSRLLQMTPSEWSHGGTAPFSASEDNIAGLPKELCKGRPVFKWNDLVFRNFPEGNLKILDFHFYRSLEGGITKRLFRFLHKRFYKVFQPQPPLGWCPPGWQSSFYRLVFEMRRGH